MAGPAIEILDPGLLSTVQDLGRTGVGELGVSPSGAADWLSARMANRLVDNLQSAALIETTMTGISFRTLRAVRMAITGAEARLLVGGVEKPLWQSMHVHAGTEVRLSAAERGLRSYVAFSGGINVPAILGSAATDVTSGFGGFHGRALSRGDALRLHAVETEPTPRERALRKPAYPSRRHMTELRVLPGPHASRFSTRDLHELCRIAYHVSARSSRQGLRLEGRALHAHNGFDVISCGMCAGSVQIASDGLPVVLLAEHQTTGGYAAPLTVITADLPDAAQLRPGDQARFTRVTLAEAGAALVEKMKVLSEVLDEPSHAR